MRAKMTSKERVLAAMQRQEVDYVPCAPFFNFQMPTQRVGKRWQYPFGPSDLEALDYSQKVLGIDQVLNFSIGTYPDLSITSRVSINGDILTKVIGTPAGELRASVRRNDHWPHGKDLPLMSDYNSAHFVEPWIKEKSDIDCLRYILMPPKKENDIQEIRSCYDDAKAIADRYGVALYCYFGHGLTGALNMFGATELCTLAADEPELVDAYLEIDHLCNMKVYEIALDLGVDFIRRNGFYETCDFFSPAMLKRFLAERLRREARLVQSAGKPIGYTVLSGYGPMLDHLAGVGFDCIICPDPFLRDGDATLLSEKLGNRTSFWTGPSDTIHMPWDDSEKVKEAVRCVFDVFGKTGLLITPCSSSKAVYPWSNVITMIDEWRNLR